MYTYIYIYIHMNRDMYIMYVYIIARLRKGQKYLGDQLGQQPPGDQLPHATAIGALLMSR